MTTREQLQAEKVALLVKLKARERAGAGYVANVKAIKERIAEIDRVLVLEP